MTGLREVGNKGQKCRMTLFCFTKKNKMRDKNVAIAEQRVRHNNQRRRREKGDKDREVREIGLGENV